MNSLLSTVQLAIVQQLCFVGDILLLSSRTWYFNQMSLISSINTSVRRFNMVRSGSLIAVNDSCWLPSFTTVYSHFVSFMQRFPSLSRTIIIVFLFNLSFC